MKKLVFFLAIICYWFIFQRTSSVEYGPGVLAPDIPIQEKIVLRTDFPFKDYTITPLAKFHIKAKTLSVKTYRSGRESELSPVDLALGWGRMSDESILESIDISQSGRWYKWHVNEFPIPRREIETNSANMHLIPANKEIESKIKRARRGDVVEFSGSLIRVDANDGWRWVSSLTRKDTGGHSCELVFVENFSVKTL